MSPVRASPSKEFSTLSSPRRGNAVVASSEIPKILPFQLLLGRNILGLVDLYALGKSKVVCVKDP
jgi:hypothetical protein